MFIPVYFSPYDDELLYSWISRLAAANGLSLSNFRKYYFNDINKRNDTSSRFYGMFWKCGMHKTFPSVKDILLKHTGYWTERIIYDEPIIAQMIFQLLYNRNEPLYDISIKNECTETHLRICPECLREDIDNDKDFYIKTWHSFKDVKMCYIHKCALYELDNYPENNEVTGEKLIIDSNSYTIAKKFYDAYKNPFSSLNNSKNELKEDATTIKGVYHEFEVINNYGGLLELKCKECGCIFIETLHAIKSGRDCPICELQENIPQKMLSTTPNFTLCKSISSLREINCIKHIPCNRTKKGENVISIVWHKKDCVCSNLKLKLEKKFEDAGFKILSIINNSAPKKIGCTPKKIKFIHNKCGNTIERNIRYYKHTQPFCPICSYQERETKRNQEKTTKFDNKLKKYTDGEYIRVGEYIDVRSPVELLHKKCGKTSLVIPMNFFHGYGCKCEIIRLRKNVIEHYLLGFEQNFTVLEWPNGKFQNYRILFNDTGETRCFTAAMIRYEATKSGEPLFFKRKVESK